MVTPLLASFPLSKKIYSIFAKREDDSDFSPEKGGVDKIGSYFKKEGKPHLFSY